MTMDEVQLRAARLMRQRKFDDAAMLLTNARDEARRHGDNHTAAYLGGLLASCLMAGGRDDEALEAHFEAEADDPANPFLKLASANFLMNVMHRPADALVRLQPAIASLRDTSEHVLEGLLGTIYLALGRDDDAIAAFRSMTRPELLTNRQAVSLDFYLVEALIVRRAQLDECRRYLDVAAHRAAQDDDAETAQRVQELLAELDAAMR
jgi:tetratricopeptide (TPR) repeat protein